MTLSEEDRERLSDVVELQPTKNAELQDRWGLESGSAVHSYLEETLGEYYYRDDNSLIRATDDAAELVDVEPGVEGGTGDPDTVRVPALEAAILDVLAGPDERAQSVVAVLHDLRAADADDGAEAEDVRRALKSLRRKGVVEVDKRTVPTYRLGVDPGGLSVEVTG